MDAVILAGGLGTRLRPVLPHTPKVLAPVAGRPFLAHVLDRLEAGGFSRVILATGYRADMVRQALGGRHGTLELAYSPEDEPLGTGGALRLALDQVRTPKVLAMNGDSLALADLGEFAKQASCRPQPARMLLVRVDDAGRFGAVELSPEGLVTAFREKEPGAGSGLINAGVYVLDRELVAGLSPGQAVSLEREVFPGLAVAGRLAGLPVDAPFLDIGLPESYARAEAFLTPGQTG